MAKRGREGALKRQREKIRQEQKAIKREKRQANRDNQVSAAVPNETALMEEFARVSERHDSGQMSHSDYEAERARIFDELGIEA